MITRRNFLKKSTIGTTAVLLSHTLPGNEDDFYIKNENLHAEYYSNSDVLEKARKNILKFRQRDTCLLFLDKCGKPFAHQEIHIEQLKHQFLFGDNNWGMSSMVRNGMGDSDRLKYYRERFIEVLNSLNTTVYWTERPRNDTAKTEDFQGELRLEDFEESVNWANAHDLTVKGHPMYWTVPKAIPSWLTRYPYETQLKFVEVRIRNLAARYKGRVKLWDAVNEMLWEPHLQNLSKRVWPYCETMENMVDYISKVITWGREEDPNALFSINDYGLSKIDNNLIDQNGQRVTASRQRKRYLELINRLGDVGAAPNLIGLQCHTGWLTPAEQMAFYDEMSAADIPLSITEFWAKTEELKKFSNESVESEEWRTFGNTRNFKDLSEKELEEIRDQYVLDYLTCAFGHPNVDSFYFWGFMDMAVKFENNHDSSHEMKPLFYKVKNLIHEQWKTKLSLKTDFEGKIRFRGFCGDYSALIMPTNGPAMGYRFQIDKNQEVNNITIKTILK